MADNPGRRVRVRPQRVPSAAPFSAADSCHRCDQHADQMSSERERKPASAMPHLIGRRSCRNRHLPLTRSAHARNRLVPIMAVGSSIEWTEATWNPVTGCTKVSPGCKFCYAERMAKRLQAMGQENYANGFNVTL